jgi:hypothetical protein
MKNSIFLFTLVFLSTFLISYQSERTVSNVMLRNVNDEPQGISFLGKTVFLLFYIDPDNQHIIDPLTEALDSKELDKENFEVVSVINCKDTWIPYFALRNGARHQQKLHPESPILFDKDHFLSLSWKLGECDNSSVIAVIGKDSKVRFIHTLRSEEECRRIVSTVLNKLKGETEL